MPIITDPDQLNQGTEVTFNTTTKKISLATAGNLSTDGVTLQALYSFCKEEWKNDSTLIKFPFPLVAITEQKFDLVNGWDFADSTTRNLLRYAGWALKDNANVSQEEYMGLVTLGSVGSSDQIYYQQSSGGAATNVVLTGPANQAVKIYGDATHGNIDYRSYFKCFIREYQKLYDQSQLSAIGQTTVTYQVYSFPLSNSPDLKIAHSDANMTDAPYSGMTITYYGSNQPKTIGGASYNFNVVINGNAGTKEQIYEFVQYKLRQATDIDSGAGTVTGKTANALLKFVGDTLVTSNGVFIENFSSTDMNSIEFYDVGGTKRTFPFVAAGTIIFNENLAEDTAAVYRMYFTSGFGTTGATLVNDKDGNPISGNVSNRNSISWTFDYDGNTQGGRTAGTDAAVTIVAIGLGSAQYVKATGTITRTNSNSFSLVSSLERNYQNN